MPRHSITMAERFADELLSHSKDSVQLSNLQSLIALTRELAANRASFQVVPCGAGGFKVCITSVLMPN